MVRIICSLGLICHLLRHATRHCAATIHLHTGYASPVHQWNLISPIDPIKAAYSRADTCCGNHGVIACQSGDATTSSTGPTCDSCTWWATPCWVVSSPDQGTSA